MIRLLTEDEREWLRKKAKLWMVLHPEYHQERIGDMPNCADLNCQFHTGCSSCHIAEFFCPSVSHYFCFGFIWPKNKNIKS